MLGVLPANPGSGNVHRTRGQSQRFLDAPVIHLALEGAQGIAFLIPAPLVAPRGVPRRLGASTSSIPPTSATGRCAHRPCCCCHQPIAPPQQRARAQGRCPPHGWHHKGLGSVNRGYLTLTSTSRHDIRHSDVVLRLTGVRPRSVCCQECGAGVACASVRAIPWVLFPATGDRGAAREPRGVPAPGNTSSVACRRIRVVQR